MSILSFRTNVVVPSSCDLYSVVAQMSSLLKSFCSPYVNSGNIPVVVFRLCLRTSAVSSVCVLFVRVLPRSCASKIKPPGLDSYRKSSLPCHLDSKHFHQNVAESLLGEDKVLRFSERRFGRRSLQLFVPSPACIRASGPVHR